MKYVTILAGAIIGAAVLVQRAPASPVTGYYVGVEVDGSVPTLDSTTLATATEIVSFPNDSTAGVNLYTYASYTFSVGGFSAPAAWESSSTLSFAVGPQTINDLFEFTSGPVTYDFSLNSITSSDYFGVPGSQGLQRLIVWGTGTLSDSDGDNPTPFSFGFRFFERNGVVDQWYFDGSSDNPVSSANVTVPDSALTVFLLAGSLVGMKAFRRTFLA